MKKITATTVNLEWLKRGVVDGHSMSAATRQRPMIEVSAVALIQLRTRKPTIGAASDRKRLRQDDQSSSLHPRAGPRLAAGHPTGRSAELDTAAPDFAQ